MRVLVVEDEIKTAEYLQQGLSESGYVVDIVHNGVDALHLFNTNVYSLVLLDVNLPGIDGWDLLETIRKTSRVRIIMLTARGRINDKLKGLDGGADDYLVKPFEFPELLARIRSLQRRGDELVEKSSLKIADLELDSVRHRVFRGGTRIDLTTKEFALLHLLMSRTGEALTRSQIISLVWDMNFDCDTNVIDVAIRRLRSKIDDPFETKLIHTLRGVGYVLRNAHEAIQPGCKAGVKSWVDERSVTASVRHLWLSDGRQGSGKKCQSRPGSKDGGDGSQPVHHPGHLRRQRGCASACRFGHGPQQPVCEHIRYLTESDSPALDWLETGQSGGAQVSAGGPAQRARMA